MGKMNIPAADNKPDLERFYSGKRVVITGGLGLIGSNLAHRLVELGASVELVDNFLPNHGANPANIRGRMGMLLLLNIQLLHYLLIIRSQFQRLLPPDSS